MTLVPPTSSATPTSKRSASDHAPTIVEESSTRARSFFHNHAKSPAFFKDPGLLYAVAGGFDPPAEDRSARAFEARSFGHSDTPPSVRLLCRRSRAQIRVTFANPHHSPPDDRHKTRAARLPFRLRSEEHTSALQARF